MRLSLDAARASVCPPPKPGPPPPPAPIPPGPARDFRGHRFGRTTGAWWRPGDEFALRLAQRVGSSTGYGTWTEAVTAAAAASAGKAGAIAICDDRGRLYLHVIDAGCLRGDLHVGARRESGYAFYDDTVRGIIDGDITVTRGDCLDRWVPAPARRAA